MRPTVTSRSCTVPVLRVPVLCMLVLRVPLLLLLLLLVACRGAEEAPQGVAAPGVQVSIPYDPVTVDPPADASFPAGLEPLTFESAGSSLNGLLYRTAGAGPHPTVVLLHGFPGNERNLDLAQAIRRAGFHVLFFHYRGAWGSEGNFSFANSLEDVAVALAFLRAEETAVRHRVDRDRIAVVGHSMGGFLALSAAAYDPRVRCVASIAGIDWGVLGDIARSAPQAADGIAAALGGGTGPLDGTSGAALRDELVGDPDAFDLTSRAGALADRTLLLVAGTRDRVVPIDGHHAPMMAALAAAGARDLSETLLDSDHSFSGTRIALAQAVVGWLTARCR